VFDSRANLKPPPPALKYEEGGVLILQVLQRVDSEINCGLSYWTTVLWTRI
jgi:hypothetical protein